MRIYGLDFTSAPTKRKPLVLAVCAFDDGCLRVEGIEALPDFAAFEALLQRDGAWVAGLDFAFGQPRKLIDNLDFPRDWEGYVDLVAAMGKREWVQTVTRYMHPRPVGDKLHFRAVDKLAGAQSPMKMHFIPVGRMFYEGARRLAASPVSVLPNRPTDNDRIAVEVYPALVTRTIVGRNSGYKNDTPAKQTLDAQRKRQQIVDGLPDVCEQVYGFALDLPAPLIAPLVDDPTGDRLDAVLGAVQASWAYTQREGNYGIPVDIDPLEGWIVDPSLLEKHNG